MSDEFSTNASNESVIQELRAQLAQVQREKDAAVEAAIKHRHNQPCRDCGELVGWGDAHVCPKRLHDLQERVEDLEDERDAAEAERWKQRYTDERDVRSKAEWERDEAIALAAKDVVEISDAEAIAGSPLATVRQLFVKRVLGSWDEQRAQLAQVQRELETERAGFRKFIADHDADLAQARAEAKEAKWERDEAKMFAEHHEKTAYRLVDAADERDSLAADLATAKADNATLAAFARELSEAMCCICRLKAATGSELPCWKCQAEAILRPSPGADLTPAPEPATRGKSYAEMNPGEKIDHLAAGGKGYLAGWDGYGWPPGTNPAMVEPTPPPAAPQTIPAELFERLAALEHERWSGWMRYLFTKGAYSPTFGFCIDPASVERWRRQMETPYAQLSEAEKESDRKEVRKTLAALATDDENAAMLSAIDRAVGLLEAAPYSTRASVQEALSALRGVMPKTPEGE